MKINSMEITYLTKDNITPFEDLILEDELALLKNGRPVTALGLVADGVAVGALTGYIRDELSFLLTSIYVAKDYRRNGCASKLVEELKALLPAGICIDCEYTSAEDESLTAFFKAKGFLPFETDYALYSIPLKVVKESIEANVKSIEPLCPSFSDYDITDLRRASNYAIENELPIPRNGFIAPDIETEISALIYEDNVIKGYLIVDHFAQGNYTLSGLFSNDNPKILMDLFSTSVYHISKTADPDSVIIIPALTAESMKLLKHILPIAEKLTVAYAFYR